MAEGPLARSVMSPADHEDARLAALYEFDVLDTLPEENFERITRLAKLVMNTPIVTITFIDRDRQWFKSSIGMMVQETARDISFCNRTIEGALPLIVTDARSDPVFRSSPLVVGEPYIRFYMGIPLRTFEGLNVGALCIIDRIPRRPLPDQVAVMQDLAGLVVDELELRKLADTDELTRSMTRRSFMREGRRAIAQAARSDAPLSCLVIDIDHFKAVNDRFGHAGGDLALQAVAAACRDSLRSMDLFGRIGGEEFAILLPEASAEQALVSAERVLQAIAAITVMTQAGVIRLTASIGLSSRNGRQCGMPALLAEADAALYQAKRSGRNRVVASGSKAVLHLLSVDDGGVR